MSIPRGVRNFNPGNIRIGDPWQGLVPKDKQTDKEFCQFINAAYGIRALVRTLITYQDKYNLMTIREIINRWAPTSENDTSAYVRSVATRTGFGADDILDMQDYEHVRPLAEAIIFHENGRGPLKTANTWYDDAVVDKGLALAGVEATRKTVGKIPVTKETVGATATGGVGVVQLADAAPQVVNAITRHQDDLSSGNIAQIVIGVLLIGLAVFIAYSQVKKHKDGVL